MLRSIKYCFSALAVAGFVAGSAFAGGEGWTEDFAQAKETAEAENKDMLLDFTGSDWCGWCIRLNEEVFSHDEFKAYAEDNFVLVELDYPRSKPQSAELKEQNAELKEAYAIAGYPTIYLTDAQGRPYAKTGYQRGGPEAYVKHLEELKQVRIDRDEQFAAAENAKGLEKAGHLHEALQMVGDQIAMQHYRDTVNTIIELDANNEAELKAHYEGLVKEQSQMEQLEAIVDQLRQNRDAAPEVLPTLDKFLANDELVVPVKQKALVIKGQIQLYGIQDKAAAKQTFQQAIDVDPDSRTGQMLKQNMSRMFPDEVE